MAASVPSHGRSVAPIRMKRALTIAVTTASDTTRRERDRARPHFHRDELRRAAENQRAHQHGFGQRQSLLRRERAVGRRENHRSGHHRAAAPRALGEARQATNTALRRACVDELSWDVFAASGRFVVGRIFCGEPLHTSPENALAKPPPIGNVAAEPEEEPLMAATLTKRTDGIPAIDGHADGVQRRRDGGAGAARARLHREAPVLPLPRSAADRRLRQDRDGEGKGQGRARLLHGEAARLSRLHRGRADARASR